jgi:hypothetical protein
MRSIQCSLWAKACLNAQRQAIDPEAKINRLGAYEPRQRWRHGTKRRNDKREPANSRTSRVRHAMNVEYEIPCAAQYARALSPLRWQNQTRANHALAPSRSRRI